MKNIKTFGIIASILIIFAGITFSYFQYKLYKSKQEGKNIESSAVDLGELHSQKDSISQESEEKKKITVIEGSKDLEKILREKAPSADISSLSNQIKKMEEIGSEEVQKQEEKMQAEVMKIVDTISKNNEDAKNALSPKNEKVVNLEEIEKIEAEKARLAQEAEKARLAQEAEKARLAQEAEKARLAQEAEKARLAQEAEKARLAQEAEKANLPKTLGNGSFVDGDRLHRGSGNVEITEKGNDIFIVFNSNFKVTSGPDLYVSITKQRNFSNGYKSSQAKVLGSLTSSNGKQAYKISKQDWAQYNGSVVVWCRAFDVLFSYAVIK